MRFALTSLALAIVCLVCLNGERGDNQVDAASTTYVGMAKEYLYKKFDQKILSKSETVLAFRAMLDKTQERFDADVKAGKINESDEAEASAAYHKLLIDEIKRFRENLLKAPVSVDDKHLEELEGQLCAQDKMMEACTRMAKGSAADVPFELQALSEDQLREEEEELELEEQRRSIEQEAEMGWSMTPEARAALKVRTKHVLSDLLNNEVRQLALAVLQAYMTGDTIGPLIIAISGALKFKIVQYLMNIVMDMLSSSMGKRVEINPMVHTNPIPAAA